MCGCQDSPVWPKFRTCICLAGHEISPRLTITSCPTSVSSISWESSWSKKLAKAGPSAETNAPVVQCGIQQLVSRTTRGVDYYYLRVVFYVRIIVLSSATKNPVVHGPKHRFKGHTETNFGVRRKPRFPRRRFFLRAEPPLWRIHFCGNSYF